MKSMGDYREEKTYVMWIINKDDKNIGIGSLLDIVSIMIK
jgi:hypothetical protein